MYLETADDYAKKYHHTYIKYDGQLAYIHGFGGNPQEGFVATIITQQGNRGQISRIDPQKIEPLVFDSQFVNGPGSIPATLFVRNPRRMWKRGLSEENTRLTCPITPLYRAYGKRLHGWEGRLTFNLVKELCNPKYPTIKEALKRLSDGQAIAISPMFAITLSSISAQRSLLTSVFGFIGEVDQNGIYIHHLPALQEVRDFVYRTKQPFSVEAVTYA